MKQGKDKGVIHSRHVFRRGFTLMELVIVIGIIGVILGAVWWASAGAHESQRDTDATNELQTVAQNTTNLLSGQTIAGAPIAGAAFTSQMITAQAIPSTYVNTSNNATADNPWNQGGFVASAPAVRTFRLSFYNVTYQGCLSLLLNGTSCQSGQTACPSEVYTAQLAGSCQPTQSGCTGAVPGASVGWTVINMGTAQTLCLLNDYTGGGGSNSVEFDYPL